MTGALKHAVCGVRMYVRPVLLSFHNLSFTCHLLLRTLFRVCGSGRTRASYVLLPSLAVLQSLTHVPLTSRRHFQGKADGFSCRRPPHVRTEVQALLRRVLGFTPNSRRLRLCSSCAQLHSLRVHAYETATAVHLTAQRDKSRQATMFRDGCNSQHSGLTSASSRRPALVSRGIPLRLLQDEQDQSRVERG